MNKLRKIDLLLRVGIAFAFLYPAIDGFFHPNSWIGFFPSWLLDSTAQAGFADATILTVFGIIEIIIGLGVLFARDPRMPALGAALILLLIVALDYSAFNVVFRDISIMLMAVALIILHKKENGLQYGESH